MFIVDIFRMKIIHKELASGKWQTLSLMEQMGNIGSEVSRARHWSPYERSPEGGQKKDEKLFQNAVERALELFDLTLDDPRWKGRLREIARSREVFCDAISGGKEYNSTLESLDKYFLNFAFAARNT